MKKRLLSFLTVLATFLIFAGSAMAIPQGTALQDVFDGITVDGDSSVDVKTDMLSDSSDSYWSLDSSGGSFATLIVEIAGYADQNTFGVYDYGNPGTYVELFAGSDSAGNQATLSITDDGSVFANLGDTGVDFGGNLFGYYLESPEGRFYSDTYYNEDGVDHMYAYQGTGEQLQLPGFNAGEFTESEYILAFEDLYGGGDRDYADLVVNVESVTHRVPEPASLLLLGTGLIGLAGFARRRRSAKS